MILDNVRVQHFRNLGSVAIKPSPSLNIIIGQNGSGKSSLLEAIHYFGFGRSFRTVKHQHVIQHGRSEFTLFCSVNDTEKDEQFKLGIQRIKDGQTLVKVNGQKQEKVSDLVRLLPLQIFTPQSSDTISGPPSGRRRFIDWGLFHVEQSFLKASSEYGQSLRQRNALLKGAYDEAQEGFWLQHMVSSGERLNELRISYLSELQPYLIDNLTQFLPEFSFEISYYRGWESSLDLKQCFERNRQRDKRYGHTSAGPHKGDVKIKIAGVDAYERLSRGQLRMLMAAMQLAQTQYLLKRSGCSCVFLLDDIGAELDSNKRKIFIDSLLEAKAQIFVTAIDKQQLDFLEKSEQTKMFHVEHGQVNEE